MTKQSRYKSKPLGVQEERERLNHVPSANIGSCIFHGKTVIPPQPNKSWLKSSLSRNYLYCSTLLRTAAHPVQFQSRRHEMLKGPFKFREVLDLKEI